jgi:phosphoribosylanthranilate isomerase
MGRTRIKICGIKDDEAIFAVVEAGADAVGFVFVEASPRYVDPDTAFALMSVLPPFMSSVAVVADPDIDAFSDIEEVCPTTYIQLHGNENEKLVKALGPDVFKAIKFDPATIEAELKRWENNEDALAILVDSPVAGSGEAFDWTQLAKFTDHISKPIILAGGLTPDNVGEAIRVVRPYAVDVSSGVERERGVKDPALIERFCRAVRAADAE